MVDNKLPAVDWIVMAAEMAKIPQHNYNAG